jgi:hypothetical protein
MFFVVVYDTLVFLLRTSPVLEEFSNTRGSNTYCTSLEKLAYRIVGPLPGKWNMSLRFKCMSPDYLSMNSLLSQ